MKKRHFIFIILTAIIMGLQFLSAQNVDEQESYRQALAFERAGEYERAEAIYGELYHARPGDHNYFTRYKDVLKRQRKLNRLMPLLEERLSARTPDPYLSLELGVVYYARDDQAAAKRIWSNVFGNRPASLQQNYANYIYRQTMEYGIGSSFYNIVKDLRDMTGMENLLVNYAFLSCVQYQNWQQGAEEIERIIRNKPEDLRHVRQSFFSQAAQSPLYEITLDKVRDIHTVAARVFISEIHMHTGNYAAAFEILSSKPDDATLRKSMVNFANDMYKAEIYDMSLKAAEWGVRHNEDPLLSSTMSLLAAQSGEQLFYQGERKVSVFPEPFPSIFTRIPFASYDMDHATYIDRAFMIYDSLLNAPHPVSQFARYRRAEMLFKIYHDHDAALKEYLEMLPSALSGIRSDILPRIAYAYVARGAYGDALEFLNRAGTQYRLMVHEEDALLPYRLYVSFLANGADSLYEKSMHVLAVLPENDPMYNDVLAFAGFVTEALTDTNSLEQWLQAERFLAGNRTAQAAAIYKNLLRENTSAAGFYGMRYLDCLRMLDDVPEEAIFWDEQYDNILRTPAADLFMLRYGEFL
ncbi:MAG: hypothetical protein K0B52_05820, partial [FCB group bacterium]|nr:hypothetical protein [FCB group bacterium]